MVSHSTLFNPFKKSCNGERHDQKERTTKARSCRCFLRNKGWWETVRDNYDDKIFYETFRMSQTTFYHILDKISDQIEKQRVVEKPISPDFRIAVTIYKLSRGDYIYTMGEMCGLAKATVCTIVSETCKVIVDTLWNDTVKKHFPSSQDLSRKRHLEDSKVDLEFFFVNVKVIKKLLKCTDWLVLCFITYASNLEI